MNKDGCCGSHHHHYGGGGCGSCGSCGSCGGNDKPTDIAVSFVILLILVQKKLF